jgi:hypothetical protein
MEKPLLERLLAGVNRIGQMSNRFLEDLTKFAAL